MVRKNISGVTCDIKQVNPKKRKEGYNVILDDVVIGIYINETRSGMTGWWVTFIEDAPDPSITACYKDRERIEREIVDTWLRTHPKRELYRSPPCYQGCGGSG